MITALLFIFPFPVPYSLAQSAVYFYMSDMNDPPPKQGFGQWISFAADRFGFAGLGYILGAILVLVIGWLIHASQKSPPSNPKTPTEQQP
ncbi:MAG: hypothetical protein J7519_10355 [Roseofilum sp. SID1]|uniref:hypothetical protein n=1 Tax=Roseofilum sp. SID2 TaxID=2821498 RepID=UPI001B256754|nr:hypothetical protein [Roseofilum sp. SID2]MBP0038093.1 hypothetical protein [Roseofilum sp. SID1]